MLIDRYLPRFDVSEVHEVDVDAPPEVTYAAIREADLFTFGDVATPEMGWALLGETPGVEFVVGSVGRFWRRDYGWRSMPVEAFAAFEEPGYAKLAVSFRVEPHGANGSRFRYEARTATTAERSRAH